MQMDLAIGNQKVSYSANPRKLSVSKFLTETDNFSRITENSFILWSAE